MTHVSEPSADDVFRLEAAVEAHRPQYDTTYGPGPYVYWYLAHHVSADGVLFADVGADRNRTEYNARSGRLFIVTGRWFWIVTYNDAADQPDGTPNQNFGTADLSIYPRGHGVTVSIEWPGRNLRTPQPPRGATPRGIRLDVGTIKVTGTGWAIELPGEPIADADAYFARLRKALETSEEPHA